MYSVHCTLYMADALQFVGHGQLINIFHKDGMKI